MKKLLSIFFLVILSCADLKSQELNCTVTVLTQQIQSSEKKIYNTLQNSIYEFMNNTRWTDDQFLNQERIECSMQITINDRPSNDEFKASIQIQARRPVYKTSYYSPLISINDESFGFRYIEFQTIEFNEAAVNQNLSAVLAFYAYMIIGFDYDSYSLNGGKPYFQKAQTIIANSQNSPEKGWRAFENTRNRYWLSENLNNPIYEPIHQLTYNYHRKGLDIMTDNKEEAITAVADAIEGLRAVHVDKPGSYIMQILLFTKSDEIVNILSDAFPEVKTKMLNILNELDPANGSKYQAIMNKN